MVQKLKIVFLMVFSVTWWRKPSPSSAGEYIHYKKELARVPSV
jgi:hypothetical protein